jgi:hypothetical protein
MSSTPVAFKSFDSAQKSSVSSLELETLTAQEARTNNEGFSENPEGSLRPRYRMTKLCSWYRCTYRRKVFIGGIVLVVGVLILLFPREQSRSDDLKFASSVHPPPFSKLHPVQDLEVFQINRPIQSQPSSRLDPINDRAIPTNSWYQNLLMLRADETPSNLHRTYPIPYVVDAAGPIPGLRVHSHHLDASDRGVTLAVTEPFALTLGAFVDLREWDKTDIGYESLRGYSVTVATDLGVTLRWVSSNGLD